MGITPLNFWFEAGGPTHFYKFRGIDEYTKRIFTDKKLYFGSAEDFNDPFDFLPIFTMMADRRSLQRYLEGTMLHKPRANRRAAAAQIMRDPNFGKHTEQAMRIAENELKKLRRSSGLLCLSSRPDHMLLWSHYANSHKGIALRFKPKKGDGYFERACKVTYQREREKLNLVLHDTMTLHKLALLRKADFWSYEEEWRIVDGPERKGAHKFPAGSLNGIVLGAKISTQHEREVRTWVSEAGLTVEWLRADLHKEEYRLEITPC